MNVKKIGYKKVFIAFLGMLLLSCDQEDNDTPNTSLNGYWSLESKGYILEYENNKKTLYSTSSAGCTILVDDFVPKEFFGLDFHQVNENQIVGISELLLDDLVFTRLSTQGLSCKEDNISVSNDPKVNFDFLWNIFNDYYAFFETRGVRWDALKNLRETVTQENLYDVFGQMVIPLKDSHISITKEDENIEIDGGQLYTIERLNQNLEGDLLITNEESYEALIRAKADVILNIYLNGAFEINTNQNILWGIIEDIGYINILDMEGYGSGFENELESVNLVLDQILKEINDNSITKLIVDIRFNTGGLDIVSREIASRFFDKERNVFSKKEKLGNTYTESRMFTLGPQGNHQYKGDIILLTSPITVSAAEVFTLCMKELPYVTIVGERTNGAFSDILNHRLPNGATIGLSNQIYSDASGVVFEGVGIGPQKEENRVPFFSNSDLENKKDSGIDRALELLNN